MREQTFKVHKESKIPLLFSSIKIGLLQATGLSLLEFSTIANLAPECYIKRYFHSVHIATKN